MTAKAAMIFVRPVDVASGLSAPGSGGIEPGRERSNDREAEPFAELQVQWQREHVASPRAHDRNRDEDAHQRFAGDETGREQHTVTLRTFTVVCSARGAKPALDEVRDQPAGKNRHRELERQIDADRNRKNWRT